MSRSTVWDYQLYALLLDNVIAVFLTKLSLEDQVQESL